MKPLKPNETIGMLEHGHKWLHLAIQVLPVRKGSLTKFKFKKVIKQKFPSLKSLQTFKLSIQTKPTMKVFINKSILQPSQTICTRI